MIATYIDRLKQPYLWRRANRAKGPDRRAPISLRIEIEGFPRAELSTGVWATEQEWSPEGQRKVAPRGMGKADRALLDMDNDELAGHVKRVKLVYHSLKTQGGDPSPGQIVELIRGKRARREKDTTFAAALELHRRDMASPARGRRPGTLAKDTEHVLWLLLYLHFARQLQLPAAEATRVWARGFERWALERGLGSSNIRHTICFAQGALSLAEQEGLIQENKMLGYKYVSKRTRPRKLRLTAERVQQMAATAFPAELAPFADLFLFMCYTGLSRADYLRFAAAPESFLKHYPHPQTRQPVLGIEMTRQKMLYTHKEFWVPLLPEARALLVDRYAYRLPIYAKRYINGKLKDVAAFLQWTEPPLSTKIARATFSQTMRERFGGEITAAMTGHEETTMNESYSSVSPQQIMSVLGMALGDN